MQNIDLLELYDFLANTSDKPESVLLDEPVRVFLNRVLRADLESGGNADYAELFNEELARMLYRLQRYPKHESAPSVERYIERLKIAKREIVKPGAAKTT